MSFNTSLSGLSAASQDLNTVSNNVANSSTVGFKMSRAEFADVYAVSAFGSSSNAIGSGVLLSRVAQQFNQGNLEFTENTLDLAISGQGFFALTPNLTSSEKIYTRAGNFGVDDNGFVVSSTKQYLQAYPVNIDGTVTSTSLSSTSPLRLPSSAGTPAATAEVEIGMNLPADAANLDPLNFDPTQASTYTSSTSLTVYDSLGNSHIATMYFVKDQTAANQWANYLYMDGNPVDVPGGTAGAGGQVYSSLIFSNAGSYTGSVPDPVTSAGINLTNGANTMTLTLDYANNSPTQYASPFAVVTLDQDGFTAGRLSGIDISDVGVVRANYTNGQSEALGKVAMVSFANEQGLRQLGGTSWAESLDSGAALGGEAGTGSLGLIQSGALESSNVDLTAELVKLITAQRNFQANSKAIETHSAVTQTIMNLR